MTPRYTPLGLVVAVGVFGGIRLGWSAPVRAGAAVGAVLVLRLAAPYVGAAVPRTLTSYVRRLR